jgi:hypothetical protein
MLTRPKIEDTDPELWALLKTMMLDCGRWADDVDMLERVYSAALIGPRKARRRLSWWRRFMNWRDAAIALLLVACV